MEDDSDDGEQIPGQSFFKKKLNENKENVYNEYENYDDYYEEQYYNDNGNKYCENNEDKYYGNYDDNNIYNYDRVSLVINMKNLTNDKHLYFNDIFQKLNATRIFYFVKTIGKQLDQNLYKFISDSNVKIVLSNFPDSIFLPFVKVGLLGISRTITLLEGDGIIIAGISVVVIIF